MATSKNPIATNEAPVTIRVRTLTDKGHELYLGTVRSLNNKVAIAKGNLVECINAGDYGSLKNSFDIYTNVVLEYVNYLKGIRTVDSEAQLTSVSEDYDAFQVFFLQRFSHPDPYLISAKPEGVPSKLEPFIRLDSEASLVPAIPADQTEPAVLYQGQSHSVKSKHLSRKSKTNASVITGTTTSSKLSAIALEQRAKVEIARTKVKFANQEAMLSKQKAEQEALRQKQEADFESRLKVLEMQRELAEEEAKLKVCEDFSSKGSSVSSSDNNSTQLQDTINERTHFY